MMLQTMQWTGHSLRLLDQTRLPTKTEYLDIADEKQMWDAIRRLVVRGAPAIGVAAGFGAFLGIKDFIGDAPALSLRLSEVCDYLATSRPTAVNLSWALKRVQRAALSVTPSPGTPGEGRGEGSVSIARDVHSQKNPQPDPLPEYRERGEDIKHRILNECLAMLDEDKQSNRAIGIRGLELLKSLNKNPLNIFTHCNAGALAATAYGTALAPIYLGIEQGMQFHVYADETRPLLQGSRLTAYELRENKVPVTVLCDNMAASLMGSGKLDAVIVGADRIAANGDVANKIGTLGVAILARHYKIPFFVAAPTSTIDLATPTGKQIPIEFRDGKEISNGFGAQTAPDGVETFNPAFDVTPNNLVDAIVTEKGVIRAPYEESIQRVARAPRP